MRIKIKQHLFSGTYYTPDEYMKMRRGMFRSKNPAYERFYIILVFKRGDMFWTETWTSPTAITPTPEAAFEVFLKSIDHKNGMYHKSNIDALSPMSVQFDAFMPRTKVPDTYQDELEHI